MVLLDEKVLPHSFLNYVFVSRQEYEAGRIDNELFIHEKAHITQKHSLDILFAEFLQMVFWFNPIIYLYKKAIRLNHEFLADQTVNQACGEVAYYQRLLLQKATGKSLIPIASNLNYSVTKKRFMMMTKHTPTIRLVSKSLLSAVFFSFSVKMNAQERENISIEDKRKFVESFATTLKDKKLSDEEVTRIFDQIMIEEYEKYLEEIKKHPFVKEPKYEIPDAATGKLKEVSIEEYIEYRKSRNNVATDAYYVATAEGDNKDEKIGPQGNVSYDYLVDKYPEYFGSENKESLDNPADLEGVTLPVGRVVYKVESKYEPSAKGSRVPYESATITLIQNTSSDQEDQIYTSVEIMPEYPGGINEFRKFVMSNFKTPDTNVGLKGSVIVTFVVEKDGSLSHVKVVRDLGYGTGEEAMRIVGLSEKWKPGIQNGKPVRVRYTLPIQVNIEIRGKSEDK